MAATKRSDMMGDLTPRCGMGDERVVLCLPCTQALLEFLSGSTCLPSSTAVAPSRASGLQGPGARCVSVANAIAISIAVSMERAARAGRTGQCHEHGRVAGRSDTRVGTRTSPSESETQGTNGLFSAMNGHTFVINGFMYSFLLRVFASRGNAARELHRSLPMPVSSVNGTWSGASLI